MSLVIAVTETQRIIKATLSEARFVFLNMHLP